MKNYKNKLQKNEDKNKKKDVNKSSVASKPQVEIN
jgi:hypothetical protein